MRWSPALRFIVAWVPFGNGRRFVSSPISPSPRILDGIIGGWTVAGVSTFWPQATPLRVPTVHGAVTAPNAAVRRSANGDYKNLSRNDSSALVAQGAFTEGGPQGAFNRNADVRTEDYTCGNMLYINPKVRNPDRFETDATIMKDCFVTEEVCFSMRVEALNFFNHANYGNLITDPDSPEFGGVSGKHGNRIMQVGLRLFF